MRYHRRRWAWWFGVLLAGGFLVLDVAGSQTNDRGDPRNRQRGEIHGFDDCLLCHSREMPDAFIVSARVPNRLPLGAGAPAEIVVSNPWKHHVREIQVFLTLVGRGGGLAVLGGTPAGGLVRDSDEFHTRGEGWYRKFRAGDENTAVGATQVGADGPGFAVQDGARRLVADVEVAFQDAPGLPPEARQGARFWLQSPGTDSQPDGIRFFFHPEANARSTWRWLAVEPSDAGGNLTGPWRFDWDITGPPTPASGLRFVARIVTYYGGGSGERFAVDVDPERVLAPGESVAIPIRLVGLAPGPQHVDVQVRARIHYNHENSRHPDDEYYSRFATAVVDVGGESILVGGGAPPVRLASRDGTLVLGEVVGIASAVLVPPSFLVSGIFGRRARVLVNRLLGGARRRVAFHGLVSLGLTVAAVAHVLLFIAEARYGILVGVWWGGWASVGLLTVGLTGYYQVPLIQRHGYAAWRRMHGWSAAATVLFTILHMVWDGAHFGDVRQELPGWLRDLNVADP